MIKLCFDSQEIQVPESWADIRLSDYERWFRAEPQTRLDQIALVADICGINADVLLNNPTQVFDVVADTVSFVFKEFVGEPINSVVIEEQEYKISFTEELTLAEWVDVESVFDSESESRLSDLLCILCRPVAEVYDSRLSDGRRGLFRDLTMDKVLPLLAFFLLQKKRSRAVSSHYLEIKDQINQYLQLIHSFAESGVGTKSLPICQRIKYFFLMKSLKKQLSKYSDFYSTDSTKVMPRSSKINFKCK